MLDSATITVCAPFTRRHIFDHLDILATHDEAIVFGTGKNVLQALDRLPPDCYHMGVNGAVDLPVHLDSRVILDTNAPRTSWFNHRRDDMLEIHHAALMCPWSDYQFTAHLDTPYMQWKSLYGDATVSGCAVSLLYWAYKYYGKPRRVYLAGLDMGGGKYFNGYSTMTPGTWSQLPNLNGLINECLYGGLDVKTLSDTLLDVEHA